MGRIRFLVMDVDGTLTDGKIYMGSSGEVMKAFDIKDGCGIKDILPTLNIIPVIITARKSQIVKNRCIELAINECHQGCRDKLNVMNELLFKHSLLDGIEYSYTNVAYIGDDILDLQCIKLIKDVGGITACPADAVAEVAAVCDFVSSKKGGNGAVRDFITWLTNAQ